MPKTIWYEAGLHKAGENPGELIGTYKGREAWEAARATIISTLLTSQPCTVYDERGKRHERIYPGQAQPSGVTFYLNVTIY